MLRTVKASEKRQASGRQRRIGGHDPPLSAGGLPGGYGNRLLPICCPSGPTVGDSMNRPAASALPRECARAASNPSSRSRWNLRYFLEPVFASLSWWEVGRTRTWPAGRGALGAVRRLARRRPGIVRELVGRLEP
jgi:hypothetical protein